jgi:hypothetical protein
MAPAVAGVGVGANVGSGVGRPCRVPTASAITTNDNATNHATKKMSFRLMRTIVADLFRRNRVKLFSSQQCLVT